MESWKFLHFNKLYIEMILQELAKLYDRLSDDPDAEVPGRGTSIQNIGFRITLDEEGTLVGIDDIRSVQKGKSSLVSIPMQVLGGGKSSGSGFNASFLWDNCGYLLGFKGNGDENPGRTRKAFEALRDKHLQFEEQISHPAFSAVCRFLEQWNPDKILGYLNDEKLCLCNGIFRIQGNSRHVHELSEIRDWWLKQGGMELWKGEGEDQETGMCLVSGRIAPLALLHEPVIKGVRNAQMSGAKLVSYNCASFLSYGKEKGFNAPVSEDRAFAYCCGLNYLLSRQETRIFMGDATMVFWADAPVAEMNAIMAEFMAGMVPPHDFSPNAVPVSAMDENVLQKTHALLKKMVQGKLGYDDLSSGDARFFILGLSPNSTRLAVRLWYESSFGVIMEALQSHYRDMQLQRQWTEDNSRHPEPLLPSPYAVLRETAREMKDVSPLLTGAYIKSIFLNNPYPDSLPLSILRRIKADRKISYIRCAALKAWLVRRQKKHFQQQTITPMLDIENKQPGYLQGRLFAVYVKTQEDVFKGRTLNTTIRDSYYASASTSPCFVMSRLARLYSQHLGKLSYREKIAREELVQEIQDKVDIATLPKFLDLEQQAYFNLGYYHQINDFCKKKESIQTEEQ